MSNTEVANSNQDNTNNSNAEESENKRLKVDGDLQQVELVAESTKSATKRQLRLQQKKEKWEAWKPLKRAKEREKLKLKRAAARLSNIDLGPSRKGLKDNKMATSHCKIRVVIDLAFDELMTDKDIAKCNKQVLRCYSFNRRAENPVQFYVTSLSGMSLAKMKKHDGYENWDVNIHEQSYKDIFKSEELVYLTSESENVITELDDSKVYIIGGLVDHNSQKGLCHQIAQESGIAHGQLPIGEYLQMKSRKVLAINHVFEILVHVTAGKTWQEAFLSVLPQRKGASVKLDASEQGDEQIIDVNLDSDAS